jgi:hypothetical protein
MSQDQWAPGANVVYKFVAVLITYSGTLATFNEEGAYIYCLKGSYRAVDTPGQIAFGFIKELA